MPDKAGWERVGRWACERCGIGKVAKKFTFVAQVIFGSRKGTMGKRVYKHIDLVERQKGSQKYRVTRRVEGKLKNFGAYPTLAAAVQKLQEAFPDEEINLTTLRLKTEIKKVVVAIPKRKYAKVYHEAKRAGSSKWLQHEEYGGRAYHPSEEACAAAVAEYLGCAMEDLRLNNATCLRHPIAAQHEIFKTCYDIAGGELPGDAADMKARAGNSKADQEFQSHPGIIASFIVSKQTIHRDALLRASQEVGGKVSTARMSELRRLYEVLVIAAQYMSEERWPEAWTESVGKGVIRFQQYWEHQVKVGVLTRQKPDGGASAAKPLIFCDTGQEYYVVPFSKCDKAKLLTQITWGKACLIERNIVSWKDFKKAASNIDAACPNLAGATDPCEYMKKWLNRGWGLYAMWRGGTDRLDIEGCNVRNFLPLFPDQKDGLVPLLTPPDGASNNMVNAQPLSEAIARLSYSGPPELLSMWACLFSDANVTGIIDTQGLEWLKRNVSKLKSLRVAYKKKNGITPHLGVLLKEFVRL